MNFINIINYMNALNVLMIDDDTIEIMKLKRVVSAMNLNHQITDAKNGEQALKFLEKKKYTSRYYIVGFKYAKN